MDVRGLTVEGEGQCNGESTASMRGTEDRRRRQRTRLETREIELDDAQSKQW